jgi:hypothetical protein
MRWRSRKSQLLELFRGAITEHLSFLRDLGYREPSVSAERRRIPIRDLNFAATFASPLREIYVSASTIDGRRPAGVVRPNIIRAEVCRQPQRTMDDVLELGLFMEQHRPDLAQQLERLMDEAQTPDAMGPLMNAAVPIVSSILANEARSIVTGERWETGFWTSWS